MGKSCEASTLSGFTVGQQTAAYTWDTARLTWVEPFSLVEGPVTATYAGIFNGTESSNHLRAFAFPGTSPHVELIKDAVFDPGPLTASFFTNPRPVSLELNESKLWHNGIEYAWGAAFGSLTPVRVTVAQASAAPIPEPGTAALVAGSLLSVLLLRRRSTVARGMSRPCRHAWSLLPRHTSPARYSIYRPTRTALLGLSVMGLAIGSILAGPAS